MNDKEAFVKKFLKKKINKFGIEPLWSPYPMAD